ncbi:MAG: sigma-54 dependent transcriptional regulator [Candidatus Cloacimonetes bacterium]|nr:sigma-54 dependent transcriptional regulator [Candidatus Cloacimonadota bacterium]
MIKKILIIDDDKLVGLTLQKLFKKNENYITKYVINGKQGICEVENNPPHLVLLDFQLPDMNGFQILKRIKQIDESIIVIMITSFGEVRKAVTAIKLGAYDFFTKPFDKEEIIKVAQNALKVINTSENQEIDIQKMMGNSEALQNMLKFIKRVSKTDISVFLEGETGTGKELFSRMIHKSSNRSEFPFITVDCGSIPETLFESELFGHKKGAFTGAMNDKKGKFELANKGTLFLDEINSLPLSMQPKFLRALQEKEIQRLGDENPIKIDIRIIAASNKNIYEDVRTEKFREDLFYRIHEFKIDLPTLNERKTDIPVIANFFLQEITKQYDRKINAFSGDAMNLLLNYPWPGNIRELKNVIKSAVLLTDSDIIEPDHLILKNIRTSDTEDLLLENFTAKAEIKIIKRALKKANNNKSDAAGFLGISRSQFYKKLEKFKIS